MSGQEPSYLEAKTEPRAQYMEAELFDPLASEYDNWFDKEGKLLFAIEVRAFREVLGSLPKPWLEIGVGSGRFAQTLGIETGIDTSIKLLEIASERGIKVILSRGEQCLFQPGSFGTVFLIFTLCFLKSPSDVLKEASRVLVPGGKIVLGLVLKESPWGNFYERKKQRGHRFYKYATFRRYDDVVTLLKEGGFSVEKVISTLCQKPGSVKHMELPENGFSPSAGFIILVAVKESIVDNP